MGSKISNRALEECQASLTAGLTTTATVINAPVGARTATVWCEDAWHFYGSKAAAGDALKRAADEPGALSGIPVGKNGKFWAAAQAGTTTIYVIWGFEEE